LIDEQRTPEHDPEKACPGLDPGWTPVFGKDRPPRPPGQQRKTHMFQVSGRVDTTERQWLISLVLSRSFMTLIFMTYAAGLPTLTRGVGRPKSFGDRRVGSRHFVQDDPLQRIAVVVPRRAPQRARGIGMARLPPQTDAGSAEVD